MTNKQNPNKQKQKDKYKIKIRLGALLISLGCLVFFSKVSAPIFWYLTSLNPMGMIAEIFWLLAAIADLTAGITAVGIGIGFFVAVFVPSVLER